MCGQSRQAVCMQPRRQTWHLRHFFAQRRDALRRLGRHDIALPDHDVVVQRQSRLAQPALHQLARGAERDHAQEVIDQRRVPAVEQLGLDAAVFRRQLGERCLIEIDGTLAERPLQPRVETSDRARQPHRLDAEPRAHAPHPCPFGHDAEPAHRRWHQLVDDRCRQRLADAHHRLHVAAVEREPRQHGQRPVPVDQVVVDAAVEPPEHVLEHECIGGDRRLVHPHDAHERAVDARIGVLREAEGQRRDQPRIALDDVRVVEDRDRRVGHRRRLQCGRDRPRLQHVQLFAVECPLDILRPAECRLDPSRQCRHRRDVLRRQRPGAVRRRQNLAARPLDHVVRAVDLARDQPVGEPRGCRDHDTIAPPADRIGRERHARRARIDHALYDHRRGAVRRIDPAHPPVLGNALREPGAPHLHRRGLDVLRRHSQLRQELPGVRVRRPVLRPPRRAYRERPRSQPRQRRVEGGTRLGSQALVVERLRRDGEERRRRKSSGRQPRQRRRLAADRRDVGRLAHVEDQLHASHPRTTGARPAVR